MDSRVFTVSEVNSFIGKLLDSNSYLKRLSVEGEISNLTRPTSGHYYFTLKDLKSEIRCIMWRSTAEKSRFIPQEGKNVRVRGQIQVYVQRGQYSIIVSSIKPVEEESTYGFYAQMFARRFQELSEKGYFREEIKKNLPENIRTVGVVTSPTGAVIHDIITTIRRRDPGLEILIVPAVVQGEEAGESIAAGIKQLNEIEKVDVIIVGRGGGTIEDLWAFNEEPVADAIYFSKKPVISSVGHETDTTISDLVADLRAPTPTAAAEFVSYGFVGKLSKLNNIRESLNRGIEKTYNKTADDLKRVTLRIRYNDPEYKLTSLQMKLDEIDLKLNNTMERKVQDVRNKLRSLELRIQLLNPEFILKRGFVMVTGKDDRVVQSVEEARHDKNLNLHFYDGQVGVVVTNE